MFVPVRVSTRKRLHHQGAMAIWQAMAIYAKAIPKKKRASLDKKKLF